MNKEHFDKTIASRIDETEELGIKKEFVEYCVDTFYSYETALKNIMSERKLQNRHKKFGSLSSDEKLDLINNFNIYQSSDLDIDTHIYLTLSVKLDMEITYYIFYYINYGKLYK